uniref:Tectonic-1-3 N-terminal domain-containing protein n=1 Tax=Eutreptiella gymnastica TaxID=73025 RepID=A0A7S1N486_9EUGL|mmetsp:Transcript_116775/g.203127  ORF Transcript_116775/g.203127 Transcript_116775/m.203127 type:complete len:664 (+) Transcript_116775:38-2029(+)
MGMRRVWVSLFIYLIHCVSPSSTNRNVEDPTIGWCMCDLIENGCDPNCCCDPDCTEQEINLFVKCLPQAHGNITIPYCVSQDDLLAFEKINVPYYVEEVLVDYPDHDQLRLAKRATNVVLCILRESPSALQAKFFKAVQPFTEVEMDRMVSEDSKLVEWRKLDAVPTPPETPYAVGDPVSAFFAVPEAGPAIPAPYGGFSVPLEGLDGFCSDYEFAKFMVGRQATSCFRQGTLEGLCGHAFNATVVLRQQAARLPTSQATDADLVDYFIAVQYAAGAQARFGPETPPTEYLPPDATTGTPATCRNAVAGVEYRFTYGVDGTIAGVAALVRVRDLTADALATVLTVAQSFAVQWEREGSLASPRPRSGRPGYISGLPVLTASLQSLAPTPGYAGSQALNGSSNTTAQAANRTGPGGATEASMAQTTADTSGNGTGSGRRPTRRDHVLRPDPKGLALPTGWQCDGRTRQVGVRFGFDVPESGCAMALTAAEFQSMCSCSVSPSPLDPVPALLLQPPGSAPPPTHVASFGDANTSNPEDWVPIHQHAPPACTLHPLGGDSWECRGAPMGLEYTFFVSRFGSIVNPQDRISGVYRTYLPRTVQWRPTLADSKGRVRAWLHWRAAFVRSQGPEEVTQGVVQAPPLLPVLPDDVFYPFTLAGKAAADEL